MMHEQKHGMKMGSHKMPKMGKPMKKTAMKMAKKMKSKSYGKFRKN